MRWESVVLATKPWEAKELPLSRAETAHITKASIHIVLNRVAEAASTSHTKIMGATSITTVTVVLLALLWTTLALANLTYPVTIEVDILSLLYSPCKSPMRPSNIASSRPALGNRLTIFSLADGRPFPIHADEAEGLPDPWHPWPTHKGQLVIWGAHLRI
ncbi:hypothetical protein BJX65DRAFT_314160 [Aspergillus insuetus]